MSKPSNYIHGFTENERKRLIKQADFFESLIHDKIIINNDDKILDLGCGVGAQIKIINRRFTKPFIWGIDKSKDQIAKAKDFLNDEIQNGNTIIAQADGINIPHPDNFFDVIIIIVVLEHSEQPLRILKEAFRVLKKGGRIYCVEVVNQFFYIYPESPSINEYWQKFNELQKKYNGHLNIGLHLPNLLIDSGFYIDWFKDVSANLDKRNVDNVYRKEFIGQYRRLFLSAANDLLEKKMVTEIIVSNVNYEFDKMYENKNLIFSYSAKMICGKK